MAFRVLPEYILEDIVEYLVFVTQCVILPSWPVAMLFQLGLLIDHLLKNLNSRGKWN